MMGHSSKNTLLLHETLGITETNIRPKDQPGPHSSLVYHKDTQQATLTARPPFNVHTSTMVSDSLSVAIGVLVLSATAGVLSRRFWLPTLLVQPPADAAATIMTNNHPSAEEIVEPPREPRFRAGFSGGPGVTVFGFPEKGGLYELSRCFIAELDFLGLDRLRPTPRPSLADAESMAEEAAHCKRMRQLGATYYNDTWEWVAAKWDGGAEFLKIGWPSTGGGVWVLRNVDKETSERGVAAIYNALNMDERCRIIEELGGTFYVDPKDCPYLDLDD